MFKVRLIGNLTVPKKYSTPVFILHFATKTTRTQIKGFANKLLP